jgi:hypothetical protein
LNVPEGSANGMMFISRMPRIATPRSTSSESIRPASSTGRVASMALPLGAAVAAHRRSLRRAREHCHADRLAALVRRRSGVRLRQRRIAVLPRHSRSE